MGSTLINVKDYGAVGDGLVDDSAAIQAALSTGQHVYIERNIQRLITCLAAVLLLPVVLLCSVWLIPWAIYASMKDFHD